MSTMSSVRKNEQGIASLLFSMIMMIVISLIVLSFAQIARNGQRNALDNRLSTQAFLAAETGVNDVAKILRDKLPTTTNPLLFNNTDCVLDGAAYSDLPANYNDLGNGVSYTCVKVNVTPNSQIVSVAPDTSKVLQLGSSNGAPIDQITLEWPKTATGAVTNCPNDDGVLDNIFTSADNWTCPYGLVRLDMTPTSTISQAQLRSGSSTMGLFAVPTTGGGGTVGFNPSGVRAAASCDEDSCRIKITDLASRGGKFAMRIMSKYQKIDNIRVTAQASGGAALSFGGGQAMIDVTGRAQDVSRRIQVRVPLTSTGGYADYALQTTESICKRFEIKAGGVDDDGAATTDCLLLN